MRKFLFAVLLLIVATFSYVGYTDMDMDANDTLPQETEKY